MAEIIDRSERLPTTTSVALCLVHRPHGVIGGLGNLVLVTKKDSGSLGLIAGGLKEGEDPLAAVYREAYEEAGLPPYAIIPDRDRPRVIVAPHAGYSSVGIIYDAELAEPIPRDGYVPQSEEISFVRAYRPNELLILARDSNNWYRPEFNLVIVRQWLRSYIFWKYGTWEGPELARAIMESWGLVDTSIDIR